MKGLFSHCYRLHHIRLSRKMMSNHLMNENYGDCYREYGGVVDVLKLNNHAHLMVNNFLNF